ncbi:hypothetical protein [Methylovulum psychrotolerans]|jgi:hypothetical protein|uniref:Uncharacterized protein n=1 Tax=Methylovulum psychrotolerans TaxID=1704499 RepID=A0A1Z4C2F9_9GAMM|nr:hypothetical protein [Methylovulum psychrotolerans]ASF47704.1 hypothetical protein CEK71_17425 [Methylovulum psychrotolerans]MBT9096317.1 hypothetical protein [Methylovulum psychrotolerans]POZ52440.1 hypothetical protein AADEFJLK_01922 [Methylovulum psychrotolerans]
MKNFLKKYPTVVLIIGLCTLFLTQQKVVMPFVYDIIKSDLFLVDSNDKASQLPISTHLTELAFNNCNTYIKSTLDPNTTITFPAKPINAWSLGNYQYVINAEVTTASGAHKYACRITYNNGDDQEGVADIKNWSVDGLSGLEKI